MRITYRKNSNLKYWENRWASIPADEIEPDCSRYPLKYSEMVIAGDGMRILEAGCGAGRVLGFYHKLNHDVIGIDFTEVPLLKLKDQNLEFKLMVCDVRKLIFTDNYFDVVLAFGLYHNLDEGVNDAIIETFRVLRVGGKVCASFRADNFQTRLIDFIEYCKLGMPLFGKSFHKRSITKIEFIKYFENVGFTVEKVEEVENMPFLYKFKYFRHKSQKLFNESKARAEGYKLSKFGFLIHSFLMRNYPGQFCNLYVLLASK